MKILIAAGLLLVIISVVILPRTIQQYNTYKSANLVIVRILGLPNCEFGYKNKFIIIQFGRKSYTQQTKCKYTKSLNRGETIKMLHSDGTDIFLFPQENPIFELASNFLLVTAGIAIILIGFLKHKSPATIKRQTS